MARSYLPRYLRALSVIALAGLLPLHGCNSLGILDVTNPDIIPTVNSASGAIALKNGVVLRLAQVTAGIGGNGPDNLFIYGGLLADEYRSGDTFVQRNDMDQRRWDPTNTFLAGPFRDLNRVRAAGTTAITALRQYSPTPSSNIGLMFAFIAFADNLAGEYYCNGIPLSSVSGTTIVYGDPVPYDSLFGLAIANADSAVAIATGTDSISARVRQLAWVVKGRALLNRGQFAAAAAAVALVSTSFHYDVSYSSNAGQNEIWNLNTSIKRYTVADTEANVGLPFVSANDPRVPRATGGPVFDSAFPITSNREGIWGQFTSVAIASGIEARLIEAEATLQAGDAATWLSDLNVLRTNPSLYAPIQSGFTRGPTLGNLADPGSFDGRVNVMFYERAFWLFSTGHRLGDMRRLVRPTAQGGYARQVNTVYPNGIFIKGGLYGDALMLPVPFDEENNPKFAHCTDRNP
jgi:starch-binding outer membrane protein, SusD/RagB family